MAIHHIRNGSALCLAALGSYFVLLPEPAHELLGISWPIGMSLLIGIATFGLAYLLKSKPQQKA